MIKWYWKCIGIMVFVARFVYPSFSDGPVLSAEISNFHWYPLNTSNISPNLSAVLTALCFRFLYRYFNLVEGLSFYYLTIDIQFRNCTSVYGIQLGLKFTVSTPSPTDHPPGNLGFLENLDPIYLGLAVPRWHIPSMWVQLFEIYGVIQTALGHYKHTISIVWWWNSCSGK